MDSKNIIQQKIEKIKNNVDFVLKKYHSYNGVFFYDVENIKNEVEKALWLAVENHEKPENMPADCKGKFFMNGIRYCITFEEEPNTKRETRLEVFLWLEDLINGYNEENIKDFKAFDVYLTGNFFINGSLEEPEFA